MRLLSLQTMDCLQSEGPALALEHQSSWSISHETDCPTDSLLMLTGCIKRDSCVSRNTPLTIPEELSSEHPALPVVGTPRCSPSIIFLIFP